MIKYWFFTIHKTAKRTTVADEFALEILHHHTAYFKKLGLLEKCLMAGLFIDQNTELGGGCFVFAAETEAEARDLADQDPLVSAGLYDYKVYEWQKVVPENI